MNESFSRTVFPSGGWQYFQPQTMWSAPNPIANTFSQQVVNIIKHRVKNPAIVAQHGLSLDPITVGDELEAFNRQRLGLQPTISAPSAGQAVVPLATSCCGH
jgi:hypothetical protein